MEGDFSETLETMIGGVLRMTFLILIVMAAYAVLQRISAMRRSLMRKTIA
jgi:hypothetical protein